MAISTDYTSGFEFYYSPLSNVAEKEDSTKVDGISNDSVELKEKDESQSEELTDEEKKEVEELKKRDMEVRSHEQAHVAAGGAYVRGGPSFSYQTGPDGNKYAVGGEVSIDTSSVSGDPEATIRKMQVVRKAALAPASPSSTDRSVAAAASQKMNAARMELTKEKNDPEAESEEKVPSKNIGYNENGDIKKKESAQGSLINLIA